MMIVDVDAACATDALGPVARIVMMRAITGNRWWPFEPPQAVMVSVAERQWIDDLRAASYARMQASSVVISYSQRFRA